MWLQMNCGSKSDQYFVGGKTVDRGDIQVEGPGEVEFYQSERYDMSQYRIPLEPKAYKVWLYFAETSNAVQGPEQRVFDVSLQGVKVLPHLDVYKEAGGWGQAISHDFVVSIDQELVIDFESIRRTPLINAIVITDDIAATVIPRENKPEGSEETKTEPDPQVEAEAQERTIKISGKELKANNQGKRI